VGEMSVIRAGPGPPASDLGSDGSGLGALAQTLAFEASAGHTGLLQAPAGASPAKLLDAVARELGPGLRVAHLDGVWRAPDELAGATMRAATGVWPEDPIFAFDAYLSHLRETGQGLVLLIDEVAAFPPATLDWLRSRIAEANGTLRVVAVAAEGSTAIAAAHRFGLVRAVPLPAEVRSARRRPALIAGVALTAVALGVLVVTWIR
jgi:hypothetical protein